MKGAPQFTASPGRPRILFLVFADYDSLERKGVSRMILERDEGGYFERVVTIHPTALHNRIFDLNSVHRVYEFAAATALREDSARPLRVLAAPFELLAVLRRVLRIVREERVHMIRATDAYFIGLMALVVARIAGLPFCISLHADYDKRFALSPRTGMRRVLRSLARQVPRIVLPRADMVLPIRQHLADWARDQGARPDRIRVIPHGVDLDPFRRPAALDIRAALDIPADAQIVSFAGRLSPDNYIGDVVEVMKQLARRRKGVVCVIAGGGDGEASIRSTLTAEPDLASRLRLVGFQPFEYVVALRRASSAALCLMGGFSLIEACAAGCPVVAYDVEWHGDLVLDGVTGFLVGEHDRAGVVASLEQLLDDPDLATRLGRAAREMAFQRHDLRDTSRIKREAYTALTSRRGNRVSA